jgi:hypothetical protein
MAQWLTSLMVPQGLLLWEQPKTLCGSIINTQMDRNEELLALSIHHGALIISLSCIIMASRSIGYPHLICHSGGDEQISCGCPPRKDPRSCCMHAEPGTCNKGVTLRAATGRAGRPCSLIMYLGPAGPGTRTSGSPERGTIETIPLAGGGQDAMIKTYGPAYLSHPQRFDATVEKVLTYDSTHLMPVNTFNPDPVLVLVLSRDFSGFSPAIRSYPSPE